MRPRVLVADDSATLRRILRALLEELGCEVDVAVDGAEALERLQRGSYSLAVVDFVMPRLNGYQLAQAMRSLPALQSLPLVLVSARADAIGERFIAQTGALAALQKPFTPDAFRALVAPVLASLPQAQPVSDEHEDPLAGLLDELRSVLPPPSSAALAEAAALSGAGAPLQKDGRSAVHARTGSRGATASGPTRAVLEAAHGRFTELLAEHLAPAFEDVAGGADVSRESVLQVLRFYLSQAKVAALFRELKPLEAGLRGNVALDGVLEAVPLGEVFQLLALQAQTGVLTVERSADAGGASVTFGLRSGRIDLATSAGLSSEFWLGRQLVAAQVVSRAHVDAVVSSLEGQRVLLGQALVMGGFISDNDLAAALRRQSAELVFEVLRWTGGRFRFEAGATLREAQMARLDMPSEGLVLEGYRRLDEWRVLEEYIPSMAVVFTCDEAARHRGEGLGDDERRVLDALDGRRTLREAADAAAMSAFDACKAVWRLLQVGAVAAAA